MNIQALSEPLFRAKGWMKFMGVMMIIYGVLVALSIIGIIVAWLPIWIGVLLFQSASLIERAYVSGDETSMLSSLGKLKTYFTISGVLLLIGIIVTIAMVVLSLTGAIMLGQQVNTGL